MFASSSVGRAPVPVPGSGRGIDPAVSARSRVRTGCGVEHESKQEEVDPEFGDRERGEDHAHVSLWPDGQHGRRSGDKRSQSPGHSKAIVPSGPQGGAQNECRDGPALASKPSKPLETS